MKHLSISVVIYFLQTSILSDINIATPDLLWFLSAQYVNFYLSFRRQKIKNPLLLFLHQQMIVDRLTKKWKSLNGINKPRQRSAVVHSDFVLLLQTRWAMSHLRTYTQLISGVSKWEWALCEGGPEEREKDKMSEKDSRESLCIAYSFSCWGEE